jgi:hypothetical protein
VAHDHPITGLPDHPILNSANLRSPRENLSGVP